MRHESGFSNAERTRTPSCIGTLPSRCLDSCVTDLKLEVVMINTPVMGGLGVCGVAEVLLGWNNCLATINEVYTHFGFHIRRVASIALEGMRNGIIKILSSIILPTLQGSTYLGMLSRKD